MSKLSNQVDLEYLMNPVQYEKYLKKNNVVSGTSDSLAVYKSNKRFYKRRIFQLTKDLLNGKKINDDVDNCFIAYINTCVTYLQFLDKRDILQEEFDNPPDKNIPISNNDYNSKQTQSLNSMKEINNANELLIVEPTTELTSNYVKIKKSATKSNLILPVKKDINLKDEKLRKKGINKLHLKKNINNVYEKK